MSNLAHVKSACLIIWREVKGELTLLHVFYMSSSTRFSEFLPAPFAERTVLESLRRMKVFDEANVKFRLCDIVLST